FPINMQFSIPGNAKIEQGISIEMHFLIPKQGFIGGSVRIRINALYADNMQEVSINPISFTYSDDSSTFFVEEPTNPNDLMHIAIDVPIEKSGIERMDFALISLTRIDPSG